VEWSSAVSNNAGAPKGVQWMVFRQGPQDKEPTEMGKTGVARFVDSGAEYDVEYKYSAQATLEAAVSDVSAAIALTPVDKFAPAAPQGITALSSASAVIVSWDRSTEPDLALYRIYRAVGDGPLARVAESTSAATYRDAAVSSGRTYRYAVSAVDKKGNESQQSKIVEIQQP
jgi:fibronectin type 3 domain-containing protein